MENNVRKECVCVCVCVCSLVAQMINNLLFLGQEDPLEKGMATFLVWRIPWTEEPGRLQTSGSQRVGHN